MGRQDLPEAMRPMKTLVTLSLLSMMLWACTFETPPSTPNCDKVLGANWGMNLGEEVESNSNLHPDRCAQVGDVWCCIF